MDLLERLHDAIQSGTGVIIKIGYLLPGNSTGIIAPPGGTVIDEDMAGNQSKRFNYTISIRTSNVEQGNTDLFKINDFIDNLENLESNDSSFIFESAEITSAPYFIQQDTSGNSMFALDVAVFVTTQKK